MQVAQKSAAPCLGSVGAGVTEAPASTSSLVQDAPTGEDTTMNVVGEDRLQLT